MTSRQAAVEFIESGVFAASYGTSAALDGFPSSAAAISCVAREQMGYAASLYKMMPNTGAKQSSSISLPANVNASTTPRRLDGSLAVA